MLLQRQKDYGILYNYDNDPTMFQVMVEDLGGKFRDVCNPIYY